MRHGRSYTTTTRILRAPVPATGDIQLSGPATEIDSTLSVGFTIAGAAIHYVRITPNAPVQRSKRLLGIPSNPYILSPGSNTGGAYVNTAVETDIALPLITTTAQITLGLASEADTALIAAPTKDFTTGLALEVDTGLPVVSVTGTLLGIAVETDTGLTLGLSRTIVLGLAIEIDTAYSALHIVAELGLAVETDAGLSVSIFQAIPTFTPPLRLEVPPILPDSIGPSRRLFRHYRTRPAGVNVYIYSNNIVSENDPDGDTTFWLVEQGSPYVLRAFWGGHEPQQVTSHERALLEAAGYTVNV